MYGSSVTIFTIAVVEMPRPAAGSVHVACPADMSDQHEPTRALDRLAAYEQQIAAREIPDGSPGMQMAGSIVFPGIPTLRRMPLLGVTLFTIGVALGFLGLRRPALAGLLLMVAGLAQLVATAIVVAERGSGPVGGSSPTAGDQL